MAKGSEGLLLARGSVALAATLMLISAGGVLAQPVSSTGASDHSAASDALASGGQADGHQIYMSAGCAGCHQANGGGGMGPKLAGDAKLSDAGFVIARILNGGGAMPAFRNKLSPDEIAAVATYVRTSFGNNFGPVTTDQVTQTSGGASAPSSGASSSQP